MAWRRTDNKPLSEPIMAYFTDAYASLGLNEISPDISGLVQNSGISIANNEDITILH